MTDPAYLTGYREGERDLARRIRTVFVDHDVAMAEWQRAYDDHEADEQDRSELAEATLDRIGAILGEVTTS
jgi:hypothetical protein